MTKLYFSDLEDNCRPLSYWEWLMELEGVESLDLYAASKIGNSDYFFCRCFEAVGEKGFCGSDCYMYNPRNGKSGCCIHYSKLLFEKTDEKITLKRKPKTESNV
jgi:hypothetical protein